MTDTLRIAQLVEWNRSGQGCVALLQGNTIMGRFSNWSEARKAYRAARKAIKQRTKGRSMERDRERNHIRRISHD